MDTEQEDIVESSSSREPRKRSLSVTSVPWTYVAGAVILVLAVAGISWLGRDTDDQEAKRAAESRIPSSASITVEVINASGVPGRAQRYADELRARGFDVVDFGTDRAKVVERTSIIERSGRLGSGRDLAEALGLPRDRVAAKHDPKLYLDLTLMLGKDAVEPEEIRPTAWRNSE